MQPDDGPWAETCCIIIELFIINSTVKSTELRVLIDQENTSCRSVTIFRENLSAIFELYPVRRTDGHTDTENLIGAQLFFANSLKY